MPEEGTQAGLEIVLAAPSATGKGTVIACLLKRRPEIFLSISMTTRARRAGEIDGVHYHFVGDESFEALAREGRLLEHAGVWGKRYGTPAQPVERAVAEGRDVIFDIDVQGATQLRQKRPGSVLIFMVPPSMAEMRRRLSARGTETPEQIAVRVAGAGREMEAARAFDYLVVNERVEQAADDIEAIMAAERLSMKRRTGILRKLKEEVHHVD